MNNNSKMNMISSIKKKKISIISKIFSNFNKMSKLKKGNILKKINISHLIKKF